MNNIHNIVVKYLDSINVSDNHSIRRNDFDDPDIYGLYVNDIKYMNVIYGWEDTIDFKNNIRIISIKEIIHKVRIDEIKKILK